MHSIPSALWLWLLVPLLGAGMLGTAIAQPEMVVLDLNPSDGIDGVLVARRLRDRSSAGLMFISGSHRLEDRLAGFAAGVIDSFQYYGAALSLAITGRVLDATRETYGYTFWYAIMAGFGVLGGIAMLLVTLKQKRMAALKV